jgi:uncharacterized protein YutE (UPF0331/DUF86 family)
MIAPPRKQVYLSSYRSILNILVEEGLKEAELAAALNRTQK